MKKVHVIAAVPNFKAYLLTYTSFTRLYARVCFLCVRVWSKCVIYTCMFVHSVIAFLQVNLFFCCVSLYFGIRVHVCVKYAGRLADQQQFLIKQKLMFY